MNEQKSVEQICLEVFGEISAIVTHEMRNALAIINEGSGLLEDLVVMSEEDGAIPAKRVSRMTESISTQVARANRLMKDLNSYAHSGDTPVATINVHDAVALMVALTRRKAAARNIDVDIRIDNDLNVEARPLLFLTAVYLCLMDLYRTTVKGERIALQLYRHDDYSYSIVFTSEISTDEDQEVTVDPRMHILAEQAGYNLSLEQNVLSLTITL